jgi:hypothetical protein
LNSELLGRFVAVKVLIAGSGESGDHKKRFIQEARSASALNPGWRRFAQGWAETQRV